MECCVYSPYSVLTTYDAIWTNTWIASSSANAYTHTTGRQVDAETGVSYYRARVFSAQLGRFVGRDPTLYWGGRKSLYQYVASKPLSAADPSGLGCRVWYDCVLTSTVDDWGSIGIGRCKYSWKTRTHCIYTCMESKTKSPSRLPCPGGGTCDDPHIRTVIRKEHIVYGTAQCDATWLATVVWLETPGDFDPHDCDASDCRDAAESAARRMRWVTCNTQKGPAKKACQEIVEAMKLLWLQRCALCSRE